MAESFNYCKRLLRRISDNRFSERLLNMQVLDVFVTCIDYDGKSDSKHFFQVVQNKMLYAVNRNTSPDLIFILLDSRGSILGLTSFKGDFSHKSYLKFLGIHTIKPG